MEIYDREYDIAHSILMSGNIKKAKEVGATGYPLFDLDILKHDRDTLLAIYQKNYGGKVEVRLLVENEEKGSEMVRTLSELFDMENIRYYSRESDYKLFLYATLVPKGSSDAVLDEETVIERLQRDNAILGKQLREANRKIKNYKWSIFGDKWSGETSDKYEEIEEKVKEYKNKYSDVSIELAAIKEENKRLKAQLGLE